jgi:hypothetical protein
MRYASIETVFGPSWTLSPLACEFSDALNGLNLLDFPLDLIVLPAQCNNLKNGRSRMVTRHADFEFRPLILALADAGLCLSVGVHNCARRDERIASAGDTAPGSSKVGEVMAVGEGVPVARGVSLGKTLVSAIGRSVLRSVVDLGGTDAGDLWEDGEGVRFAELEQVGNVKSRKIGIDVVGQLEELNTVAEGVDGSVRVLLAANTAVRGSVGQRDTVNTARKQKEEEGHEGDDELHSEGWWYRGKGCCVRRRMIVRSSGGMTAQLAYIGS